MLNVVAEFVRDDVRFREFTRRSKSPRQLVEKSQIEIDLAVAWTIERTGRRLCRAARRLDRIAEEHDTRPLIAAVQCLRPHALYVVGDGVHEVDQPLFLRRALDLTLSAGRLR